MGTHAQGEREGRGAHGSRFTIHDSQFTVHGSRFTERERGTQAQGKGTARGEIYRGRAWDTCTGREGWGGELTVHDLRFAVHGSGFAIHGSRFEVHGSWFMIHGS